MKFLILAIAAGFGLGTSPALAISEDEILGSWQYDGFLYEGHRYPNPNANLELTMTFKGDGFSLLRWARKNEQGFCERVAAYKLDRANLKQKVTWVNPANAPECRSDADMQLGHETETVISLSDSELNFNFDLNGKPFLYILKRIVSSPATAGSL